MTCSSTLSEGVGHLSGFASVNVEANGMLCSDVQDNESNGYI